jgi:protein-tyrosine phosphatase
MDAIAQAYGSVEQFLADDLRIDVGQLRGHYLED